MADGVHHEEADARAEPPTLLLVDDTESNLRTLHAILRKHDYRLLVAKSGEQALQIAARNPPDLVLLDIVMPGIDGFETCRRLKTTDATHETAVIFLSTLDDPTTKVRGFEAGAVDYISKPFDASVVSARVKSHLALTRLNRELRQSNERLSELNEQKNALLGMAAHDLRNPLTVIKGGVQLVMALEQGLSGRSRDLLARVLRSGDMMLALIGDLLDVSSIEAGKLDLELSDADAAELLEGAVELVSPQADAKGIGLSVAAAVEDSVLVRVDPRKLEQVLMNLLSNAVKYSPAGSTVVGAVARDQDCVEWRVTDQGLGMTPEEIEGVFEPFATRHGSGTAGEKSTGLGLAIVRRVVEGHGGSVHIESTPGQGSCFRVRVPVSDG